LIALERRAGTNRACNFCSITPLKENVMLQKEGFFRRPDPAARGLVTPASAPQPSQPASASPAHPSADALRGTEKTEERKEARLVVGPDIKMKGVEINDCDTLQVEGRIEATLDARVLEITEKGVFNGTVAVDNAEIHGKLEGELTVRKQLVVHGTGRVSGKIRYARIKVEEGAELSGEISVLDRASSGSAAPRRASMN
jgi:cytoskeletal protein CcmA (bactofilin family)